MKDLLGYVSEYEIGDTERLQWDDLFTTITK